MSGHINASWKVNHQPKPPERAHTGQRGFAICAFVRKCAQVCVNSYVGGLIRTEHLRQQTRGCLIGPWLGCRVRMRMLRGCVTRYCDYLVRYIARDVASILSDTVSSKRCPSLRSLMPATSPLTSLSSRRRARAEKKRREGLELRICTPISSGPGGSSSSSLGQPTGVALWARAITVCRQAGYVAWESRPTRSSKTP